VHSKVRSASACAAFSPETLLTAQRQRGLPGCGEHRVVEYRLARSLRTSAAQMPVVAGQTTWSRKIFDRLRYARSGGSLRHVHRRLPSKGSRPQWCLLCCIYLRVRRITMRRPVGGGQQTRRRFKSYLDNTGCVDGTLTAVSPNGSGTGMAVGRPVS
jgi:hypothetical protein